jgi:hypothetical protein
MWRVDVSAPNRICSQKAALKKSKSAIVNHIKSQSTKYQLKLLSIVFFWNPRDRLCLKKSLIVPLSIYLIVLFWNCFMIVSNPNCSDLHWLNAYLIVFPWKSGRSWPQKIWSRTHKWSFTWVDVKQVRIHDGQQSVTACRIKGHPDIKSTWSEVSIWCAFAPQWRTHLWNQTVPRWSGLRRSRGTQNAVTDSIEAITILNQ